MIDNIKYIIIMVISYVLSFRFAKKIHFVFIPMKLFAFHNLTDVTFIHKTITKGQHNYRENE